MSELHLASSWVHGKEKQRSCYMNKLILSQRVSLMVGVIGYGEPYVKADTH